MEQLEEQFMDERRNLTRMQGQLASEEVGEFEFRTLEGVVRLQDVFGGREELVVVHSMGSSCAYCTLWADGFNGILPHLENRAAFVVVSPDPPELQQSLTGSRAWKFRMLSDSGGEFARAMGFLRIEAGGEYLRPGVSAFWRPPSGKIQRTGASPFSPGDAFCSAWHLFGLLKHGSENWQPKQAYRATP